MRQRNELRARSDQSSSPEAVSSVSKRCLATVIISKLSQRLQSSKKLKCCLFLLSIVYILFLFQWKIKRYITTPLVNFLKSREIREKYKHAPQVLFSHGSYIHESAKPHISQDIWYELVDNEESFYVRPYEKDYPESEKEWVRWLNKKRNHPVTVIMNNNLDYSWPDPSNAFTQKVLEHENLKYLYVGNPIIQHEKVRPLPIGLKYQFHSTQIYGETKYGMNALYRYVSTSPEETEQLFLDTNHTRTPTIWIRPMATTDAEKMYPVFNDAIKQRRYAICELVKAYAHFTICTYKKMRATNYFTQLKTHSFVVSPTGHGLDSHATWEALLVGSCIPIIPHSPLDSMFENLPVWLVDSWDEVTDEAMVKKLSFFKKTSWNWEKVFIQGWAKEIPGVYYQGNQFEDGVWIHN